jgi:hypothetical protein
VCMCVCECVCWLLLARSLVAAPLSSSSSSSSSSLLHTHLSCTHTAGTRSTAAAGPDGSRSRAGLPAAAAGLQPHDAPSSATRYAARYAWHGRGSSSWRTWSRSPWSRSPPMGTRAAVKKKMRARTHKLSLSLSLSLFLPLPVSLSLLFLADVDFFFSLLSFVCLSAPARHTYVYIHARAYTHAHAHAHFRASLLLTHPIAFPVPSQKTKFFLPQKNCDRVVEKKKQYALNARQTFKDPLFNQLIHYAYAHIACYATSLVRVCV